MNKPPYEIYFDDPNCSYNSDFDLLCQTETEVRKIDKRIHSILKICADQLKQLRKQYPSAGIGDTHTDESIIAQLYSYIH